MSRVRTELSVVQFQVQARQANASMEALQNTATNLRGEIDSVKQSIKAIGNVDVKTPELVGFENQLTQLERKLKDVNNAQRELTKGVMAADKVWKAAQTGTMEQLTIKELKAGERGVRARMQNLSPGDADDAKAYRAYGAVLEEIRIATRGFESEVQHVMQTIHDGGNVSTDMLKRAKDGLHDLKDVTAQGTKEWNDYRLQLEELGRYEQQQIDTERRLRGEIVNANDAREAAKKLTKEGAEAARQASQAYEEEIKAGREKIAGLAEQRDAKEAEARATNETIVETDKLIAKKRDEIDATEKAIKADKKQADSAHQKAEQTRNIAEQLKTSVEQQEKAFEKEKASVEKLENEIGGLQGKLQALGTQSVTPQVDTSEVDELQNKLGVLRGQLESIQKNKTLIQEKIASAQEKIGDEDRPWTNEKIKEALKEDRVAQEESIAKLDEKWNNYWETQEKNAREFAAILQKSGINEVDWDEFYTHVTGPNAEKAKSWYRVQKRDLNGVDYWGTDGDNYKELTQLRASKRAGAATSGMLEELKLLESLKRKWDEYQKALSQALHASPKYDAAHNEITNARDEVYQQETLLEMYKVHERQIEEQITSIEKRVEELSKIQQESSVIAGAGTKNTVNEVDELQADITSLSGTIEELKKQREKLTAVQTAGAEAAKKDGEAIKMSAEEAQAALDKRKEKSTVTIRGDNGLELSNPAEFFNRVKAFILNANPGSGAYKYHDEVGFQTSNKEQLKNVAKKVAEMYGLSDEYGRDDISAAMEVLRRFSLGKSGGPVKGGSFDKNQGILKLAFDAEAWQAYIDESKKLFAITKGVTQATNEQSAANERNAQSEKELAEAEQKRAVLTQQITVLETQRQQKQEQLSQLQQQAAQDTGEQERLTEELANKTAELTKKKEELSAQEKQLNFAKEEAVRKDKEATELESKLNQTSDERTEKLKEQRNEEQALIAQREEQVKKLVEQNQQTAQLNQQIGTEVAKVQEAEQKKAQAQELTADNIRRAIAELEEENKTLSDSNPLWVVNERLIAQYNQRLDEMKRKSDELRREPVTEMMQQRIQNIGNLSNAAVAETRKFWQAMYDGAERNDPKLKEIEQNLKAINAEEQKRNAGALKESAGKLLGDITTLSEGELRKSIEAAREYQKTLVVGEEEHRKYSEAIVVAENRISKFGVEAERASRRQAESIQLMQDQLGKGDALTESALKAQINYWQRLADDPKEAAENVALYRKNMEQAKSLLDEMSAKAIQESAGNLLGDITTLSEGELRKSIEAAKEYQKTLVVGEDEHKKYSQAIIEAEEHLEQFGLKAERAAKKQADAMNEMESTLAKAQSGEFSTASIDELTKAIKLLKEYQALIKDPNGAGKDTFEATRTQVEALSSQLESLKGNAVKTKAAFASADEVIQRFNEHSGGDGQPAARAMSAAEKMAHTQSEALKQAYDESTASVEKQKEVLDAYEQELQEAEEEVRDLEDELDRLNEKEQKRKNWLSNFLGTFASDNDEDKAAWAQAVQKRNFLLPGDRQRKKEIERELYGDKYYEGAYDRRDEAKRNREGSKTNLEAAELNQGAARAAYEEAVAEEEKLSAAEKARYESRSERMRMTREEIKQGIKLLEEEAMAQDRTTTDGKQRWAELRQVIEDMNRELLEASGDLMSVADAEKIASTAGKDGFAATSQQIQAATKALDYQREAIIKTIQRNKELGLSTEAEEDELEDLTKKLRLLKFEQDNFNVSQEKMHQLMESPKQAVNLDELRAAIKRADGELHLMQDSLGENSEEYEELAKQVKNAKTVLKGMEDQAKATTSVWTQAWSRLKTYVGMYMGFNAVWQRMTGTMDDLMELSDKMGEVRKTTNLSAEAVGELATNLKKLDVRTSLTDLMNISASAGQLGLQTVEDVQGFTEAANKLMIALPEMGQEAATEMMRVAIATGEVDKIRKQLQDGTVEGSSATAVAMEKIGSTVDRLRASSASTAPEITDFVKRMGAIGAQSGISIDQIAALGSTISSLGMRVETSATALSRMIPAIRNNAFDLAGVLDVTPDSIRQLFDAGRGMEVIMMILQHIKDKNLDEDSIETLLGMGGMQEVMKELNQQGARAGIVFSGLSQNVDVLRQQLGIASQAYEENIAIQNEFDKMNETTAAKWERLKNQVEEMFVGDTAQRYLGVLIDLLRGLINLITGPLRASLLTILTLVGLLKIGLGAGLVNAVKSVINVFKYWRIAIGLVSLEMKAMSAAQWGNIFTAIAGAVLILVMQLKSAAGAMSAVEKAVADLEAEYRKGVKAIEDLFRAEAKSSVELENKRKKLEELKKAGKDTAAAEKELEIANVKHAESIREINSKYSEYLGYMLSETTSAQQLAAARDLINSKLRETITLKQQEAALGNVEEEYGKDVNKTAGKLEKQVNAYFKDYRQAARVSAGISSAAERYAGDAQAFEKAVRKVLNDELKGYKRKPGTADKNWIITQILGVAEDYRGTIEEYNEQENIVKQRFDAKTGEARRSSRENTNKTLNAILKDWNKAREKFEKAQGEEKKQAAVEMYQQQRNYTNAYNNNSGYFENDKRKRIYEKNITNMGSFEQRLRNVAGKELSAIDQKATNTNLTNGNNNSQRNPWGNDEEAASTDWKKMTGKQLVARREQMNKFVNALQNDTDVKAVLAEDAALMKAFKGRQADMRSVIEWYNTERLKIQEELHARHLTNTGDWMDPKAQRRAKNQIKDDMKYYLDELDAYYTERKAKIQDAQNDGEISEAEAQNRTLANDAEWRKRRAELQQLYADKAQKVAGDEQQAIFNIISERTGDTADFVQKDINQTVKFIRAIGEKSRVAAEKIKGSLDKETEKDFLRQRQAIGKHLEAIQAILDKERPFNGITKDLQNNLTTMGILTAHLNKERNELMAKNADMTEFNHKQSEEMFKELAFLLRESETAFSTTAEELMQRAAKAGLQAWVDEMKKNPQMQEGLMAQLRSTYDAVQDAIKKEATIIKRQLETQWSDILPGADMSRKDTFEKAISDLGLMGDQVNRANNLISAGTASQRVADKLAIKQLEVQLRMQQVYYAMMQKIGNDRVRQLNASAQASKREAEALKKKSEELKKQGRLEEAEQVALEAQDAERRALNASFDAEYAQKSLNLAKTKELAEEEKQRVAIQNQLEESQNRLYTQLRELAGLMTSSLQSLFEASHAGDAEYYNELAKLNLTGSGGPGAGTYVVIENEGTSDATAHYEYLDQRQALERQREIEQQNAVADAWKKVMDDINMKMSDMITDQVNAMLQNASVDANTQAVIKNTEAIYASMGARDKGKSIDVNNANIPAPDLPGPEDYQGDSEGYVNAINGGGKSIPTESPDVPYMPGPDEYLSVEEMKRLASNETTETIIKNAKKQSDTQTEANEKMKSSTQSLFAKMTQAANLYGIAYQTMSNDNLDSSQKFEMIALQAAGNAAIAGLTAKWGEDSGEVAGSLPAILAECLKINPIWGTVIFAALSAALGGLMGIAASKIAKSKAQISQATGASVGAGRLSTGMLTYAEGNVNEFTDPASLTPGRQYNVDAADGRTYRARYMGNNPKTHLTNGPEFHLSGEKGREMIIDAGTTRQITMNETGIWHAIQTLSGGGRIAATRRGGGGMRAFADGNVSEFEDMSNTGDTGSMGIATEQTVALQASIDRQSDLLERALREGIKGVFNVYGKDGLVDSYDRGKKTLNRHGEKY